MQIEKNTRRRDGLNILIRIDFRSLISCGNLRSGEDRGYIYGGDPPAAKSDRVI
jgi:hypothetical protein